MAMFGGSFLAARRLRLKDYPKLEASEGYILGCRLAWAIE